jgi:hypothetical protein
MNVGDLVMVSIFDREKPGLILQFEGTNDGMPGNVLVLTGPRQLWVARGQVRPFPAASMAQSRRAARQLEKLVIEAKGGETNDD